ncbi:protein kinase, partial [Streptomyces milbemycinicus]
MDEYAGRVLADRYRLPLPPADEYELVETRAFDTYSGQEVHLRQIPLPETVEAEVVGDDGRYGAGGPGASAYSGAAYPGASGALGRTNGMGRGARTGGGDPAVRRAIEAATAAAQVPDHPRLDQVFHVFVEAGSLWIVSELVAGRPLAALLAERTLSPYRAAELAHDILTALRALHTDGWIHRNITARTVLVCDDGRAMLTGLAAGAAEEALCGYDPVPRPSAGPADRPERGGRSAPAEAADHGSDADADGGEAGGPAVEGRSAAGGFPAPRDPGARGVPGVSDTAPGEGEPRAAQGGLPGPRGALEQPGPGPGLRLPPGSEWRPAERIEGGRTEGPSDPNSTHGAGRGVPGARPGELAPGGRPSAPAPGDPQGAAERAARASAIAAYAAGARAAARANVEGSAPRSARPGAADVPNGPTTEHVEGAPRPAPDANGTAPDPYADPNLQADLGTQADRSAGLTPNQAGRNLHATRALYIDPGRPAAPNGAPVPGSYADPNAAANRQAPQAPYATPGQITPGQITP